MVKTQKIIGHEKYTIDENGNIFSTISNAKMKPYGKFCYIKINSTQYCISDLVGWNFIKNDHNIHYVNKDGDYYNNKVNNLIIDKKRNNFKKIISINLIHTIKEKII